MRRSISALIVLCAATLAVVAGCGSPGTQAAGPSASAAGPVKTFSDPAHGFSVQYDSRVLRAELPSGSQWLGQFTRALGSGGKTRFVVAFYPPVSGSASPAPGQVPVPVQAIGVTADTLSADAYKKFTSTKNFRAYAKELHVKNRAVYGPSTQTQVTRVSGYPAISSASYRADKTGEKALIWSVSVFTPRWNYLFYMVSGAPDAKVIMPVFNTVLRSLKVG